MDVHILKGDNVGEEKDKKQVLNLSSLQQTCFHARERERMVVVTTVVSPTEHEHFSSFR